MIFEFLVFWAYVPSANMERRRGLINLLNIVTINQLIIYSINCQNIVKILIIYFSESKWRLHIASLLQPTIKNKDFSLTVRNDKEKQILTFEKLKPTNV